MTHPDPKGIAAYNAASAKEIEKDRKKKTRTAKSAPPTRVTDKPDAAPTLKAVTICPKCGADGSDPCLTQGGKVAKKNHKERP